MKVILQVKLPLVCPACTEGSQLLHPVRWKDGKRDYEGPRSVHGTHNDVLLVSRVCMCPRKHQIIAHDAGILKQSRNAIEESFILFHKTAITRDFYRFFLVQVNYGLSSHDILTLWYQSQFDEYMSRKVQFQKDISFLSKINKPCNFPEFEYRGDYVCQKIIASCLMYSYFSKELLYTKRMIETTAVYVTADHTFKVPANIGFWYNGKWIPVFNTLFIVMNEIGKSFFVTLRNDPTFVSKLW